MESERSVEGLARRLFANPWTVLVLLTLLGLLSAFLVLGREGISYRRLAVGAVFGFALGAAHLVEVRLRVAPIWNRLTCGVIGLGAGLAMAWLMVISPLGMILSSVGGLLLGLLSREWIRHVNLP